MPTHAVKPLWRRSSPSTYIEISEEFNGCAIYPWRCPVLRTCVCWSCRVISERLEEHLVNDKTAPKYPEIQTKHEADAGQADGKYRLLTLDGLDARTAAYRETRRLIDEVESDLGGVENISAMERQMVQHGAVLGAIAADLEAQYLKGRRIDLVSLCTVLNAQRRAFDAIGYKRRQRDVTPSLQGFLNDLKDKAE
jgi:hypothetical protein